MTGEASERSYGMEDLFTYPTERAFKRPGTSAAAARLASSSAPRLRQRAMEAIEAAPGGLTAEEVAQRLGHDKCSIRARVSELFKSGRIADSGRRRKSALGASCVVWVVAPAQSVAA